MPKIGDVVLYSFQEKTYNALVLAENLNQPDLLGTHGEPMLHLSFLAPDRESGTVKSKFTYIPQVFTEYDVPHASAKKGISGSWAHVEVVEDAPEPEKPVEDSHLIRRAVRLVKGSKAK